VDPVPSNNATGTSNHGSQGISISPIEASSTAESKVQPPHVIGVDPPDPIPERPVAADEGVKAGNPDKTEDGYVDYLWGKLKGLKNWFLNIVNGDNIGEHH
jgi:hypothetical protein